MIKFNLKPIEHASKYAACGWTLECQTGNIKEENVLGLYDLRNQNEARKQLIFMLVQWFPY